MDKFLVRRAVPSDAEEMIQVYYHAWMKTYPNQELGITREIIEQQKLTSCKQRNRFRNMIVGGTEQTRQVLVAQLCDSQEIIGFSEAVKSGAYQEITLLYVTPGYCNGKGVGAALMEAMLNWFDPHRPVTLYAAEYNTTAIRFYGRYGFCRINDPEQPEFLLDTEYPGKKIKLPLVTMRLYPSSWR
jgi:ribosomal protein S18 acetylase RimI-like enzyme